MREVLEMRDWKRAMAPVYFNLLVERSRETMKGEDDMASAKAIAPSSPN